MGRAASIGLAAEWRARLGRWRRSRLSIAEFCRREQLSQPSFFAWRRRLADLGVPSADRRQRSNTTGQERSGPNKKTPRLVQLAPLAWPQAAIQIALPSGALVTLPSHASSELVSAAIRAAMRAPAAEDRPC
jgi:hypothetical protein